MNNETLKNHPYVQEIISLNKLYPNRNEFHKYAGDILQKMGSDNTFLKEVIKRNFGDDGYLNQQWSLYNIPFFYIYECNDFILKIHLFTSRKDHATGHAAHCVHHHNNYILTTAAIFGSGYETMLFNKNPQVNTNLETNLNITKHFTQLENPVHTIDAWEPHLVYLPQSFSATLQLWSTDKIRTTDNLRSNPILKMIKMPLRKIIQLLKMEITFGIAQAKTYQWYPLPAGGFKAIEENEYFAPTRAAKGPEIDNLSMQTIAYFLQKNNLVDELYFQQLLDENKVPNYYITWLKKLINHETIEETFAKEEINIPIKKYRIEDILKSVSH